MRPHDSIRESPAQKRIAAIDLNRSSEGTPLQLATEPGVNKGSPIGNKS